MLMLIAASASVTLAQTESGVMRRAAELRELPAESARSLAPLPPQTLVTRLGDRQGPWIQVRTAAGVTGWVHLFEISAPGAPAASASGGNAATSALRGLTSLFSNNRSGSSGTTVSTASVGIRGLSAEDIANAQPNLVAVGQMEALRQNETQARAFASNASLSPIAVDPLPNPTATAQGRGQNGEVAQ